MRRLEVIGQRREEEILAEHGEDETLASILRALFALSRFEAEGFELQEIMISSELPPRLTLILEPAPG